MTILPLGRVVIWMAGALLSFSVLAVSIRQLAGVLSIFEIMAIRSGVGLIIVFGLLAVRPELRAEITLRRLPLHGVRNLSHFVAQYIWVISLTLLPLTTVFALEFTTPVWVVPLAIWLLGERLSPSRIGVVVLGLIGVLVIVRPGLGVFNPATFLVLIVAFGIAISVVTTKMLTPTESAFAIIFWMASMQFPIAMAGSDLFFLTKLDLWHFFPLLGVGIGGTGAHYCLSNAFHSGDATLVVPMDFLRIPLIALVGWTFYGESLDIYVLLGALIIIAGILWNLRAESKSS